MTPGDMAERPAAAAPADAPWQGELAELAQRRAHARALGGAAAVDKHHQQGRLTIRERIDGVVDAGSFREVGQLTGAGKYDARGRLAGVTPAPYVMGLAK
ncbi:MAG: carboxyl transferase domain-containing protein, partial [Betaproteobacteria bacterium]